MITQTMRYRDDPPMKVTTMSVEEFVQLYPRMPVLFNGEPIFETTPREIICDDCNEDITDTVVIYGDGLRGYCLKCAQKICFPYCDPPDSQSSDL
jgi:hypothetical protein